MVTAVGQSKPWPGSRLLFRDQIRARIHHFDISKGIIDESGGESLFVVKRASFSGRTSRPASERRPTQTNENPTINCMLRALAFRAQHSALNTETQTENKQHAFSAVCVETSPNENARRVNVGRQPFKSVIQFAIQPKTNTAQLFKDERKTK